MNWAAVANGQRSDPGVMRKRSFGEGGQEQQARPGFHRTLTDITNITAQSLVNKRPFIEPKTPAKRSVLRSNSGFAVFEDVVDEAPSARSPPQVPPKGRGRDKDCFLGESGRGQMLGIEELSGAELPPIQDFADRVSEEDRYWHANGFEDGPDGFGRPEDLADMLAHGPARERFEAESTSELWSLDFGEPNVSCPGMAELNRMAWQPLSPSPLCQVAESSFSAFDVGSSPLLAAMEIEMDVDSGSEGEHDMRCQGKAYLHTEARGAPSHQSGQG